jgi:hypothetical protein
LLYGDVENTGFYEKLPFRRSIMAVLKHLWSISTHREAFRGIALNTSPAATSDVMEIESEGVAVNTDGVVSMSTDNDSNDEENYFLRFANGLMNETNFLVSSIIADLGKNLSVDISIYKATIIVIISI